MKSNVAKKVSLYGLLTAAALLFGYVEYLLPLNFIAPGIKLGIANGIILMLILVQKPQAAFLINIVRILLSSVLFATPFSLLFSLTGGMVSVLGMILVSRSIKIGYIGVSVVGGILHNFTQLLVANFTVGQGVWFYFPFLFIAGSIAGVAVGFLVWIVLNKTKNSFLKYQ